MDADAGYSGKPLSQKLGLKADSTVVLIDAPVGIEGLLAPLPDGVTLRRGNRGRREMTIWFVTSRRELEQPLRRRRQGGRRGNAVDGLAEALLGGRDRPHART